MINDELLGIVFNRLSVDLNSTGGTVDGNSTRGRRLGANLTLRRHGRRALVSSRAATTAHATAAQHSRASRITHSTLVRRRVDLLPLALILAEWNVSLRSRLTEVTKAIRTVHVV